MRTATRRQTWKAVTMGTPSCSTLAVMDISAMPPGEVPSTRVAGCRPVSLDSSQAKPAQIAIMNRLPTTTEPSQRGAVCTKAGVKRTPRLTPITSWAAALRAGGTADRVTPQSVSVMVTSSAPMNQGLARPSRRISSTPSMVSPPSTASPLALTSRAPGGATSSPLTPQACIANGMMTVTSSTRRLCAEATRSVRAPCRSAIRVISEAPPMAPAK